MIDRTSVLYSSLEDLIRSEMLGVAYTLGCPSLTCFFENKKVQPISVVFGGWFEVSQKDF